MEDSSIYDYTSPVQRVLLQPNIILGIGIGPALAILVLTIVLMNTVSVWTAVVGLVLYCIAKTLCKKDSYMLEVLFDRIMACNEWRA